MPRLVLLLAALASGLVGCHTARSPMSLDSSAPLVIPSEFPADVAQFLVSADEVIVQTSGDWTTRSVSGLEVREPNGVGVHVVQVVGIRGKEQYSTPPIIVQVGGEVVVAQTLCFVDVRDRSQWRTGAAGAGAEPAALASGCDGVYTNTTSVVWSTPTSGTSCWSDLNFNPDTGGWSRTCNRPNATVECKALVNFADGTNKNVTFACNAMPPGGFRGNGSTVSINGSTDCQ